MKLWSFLHVFMRARPLHLFWAALTVTVIVALEVWVF